MNFSTDNWRGAKNELSAFREACSISLSGGGGANSKPRRAVGLLAGDLAMRRISVSAAVASLISDAPLSNACVRIRGSREA